MAFNRHSSVRCCRLVGLAVLGLAAATAAHAADPFYENLLRKGQDELNRREFVQAARTLRLACFGFLEEPKLLAVGLTDLALAQAAAGDDEAFQRTFRRLVEVEERFTAWTDADLSPELRKALKQQVLRRIPEATLTATPFRTFLPTPEERIAALPETRRSAELERLVREQPDRAVWKVYLGELELGDSEAEKAFALANDALIQEPGNARAMRLRGLAAARLERWRQAVDDLAASGASASDDEIGPVMLRAFVALKRWQDAAAVVEELPAAVKGRRDLAEMIKDVRRHEAEIRVQAQPPSDGVDGAAGPEVGMFSGDASRARPAVGSEVTDADRQAVARARALLAAGRSREALETVGPVADEHPDWIEAQQLVGELEYRLGHWTGAVEHLSRSDVVDRRPDLMFYEAVSLFETGRQQEAADMLRRCLPKIRKTPFVESYAERILGN